jgi:glycosyltransferase involved in cell wall biosynthesis
MAEPALQRVLLTGDTVGGVWTFTLDLAEGLIASGVEVCLATFGGIRTAPDIPGLTWLASNYKLEWMEDAWSDVEEAGRWVLAIAEQFQPDVIHLNTLCHGALPWQAPVVTTVHSCVVSWWAAVKREPLPGSWSRYRWEVQRSLQSSDLVTAPSHEMAASTRENYGLNACVIPNGRSAKLFRQGLKEPFILSAGRLWDEGKNVSALTNIAPRLPWPVFLAGDNQGLDLRGTRLLGQLSAAELASWYARAAIYALPARYEPFGLSVLEAALSGCALVLGDIPSLRELWRDAALFVSPQDLEPALRRLIENARERETLARRAQARAREYSQSRMVASYLDAYNFERRLACAS